MGYIIRPIPATLNQFTSNPAFSPAKKKVAGYARVSTDLEEQQSSYDHQVKYYTEYITRNPDWEFAGIYTDEGISATSTTHREGFKEMIADAVSGKIDLIITKSVSRFARNTVDSLTTVRMLKEKGIEIYFEKENIWTLDSKGELLITIMSSLAQEESRSISENTTWGKRKAFAEGKASVSYTRFLGYDQDFKINEAEAEVVRLIYKMFLTGLPLYQIKKNLEKMDIKTASGLDHWSIDTIRSMLTNEKYKGDALLQKQFITDFLTKKRKNNQGELQQYYVEGHHEAIIDPSTFDLVQVKWAERKAAGRHATCTDPYSPKIICGDCGHRYGRVVWHSNSPKRKVVYRCTHKYLDDNKCTTPSITEQEIQNYFMVALGKLAPEKDEVVANLRVLQETACETESINAEIESVAQELQKYEKDLRKLIDKNAGRTENQAKYKEEYDGLYTPYSKCIQRIDELQQTIRERDAKRASIDVFISALASSEIGAENFDMGLWANLVDRMTINSKEDLKITFIGGLEIAV